MSIFKWGSVFEPTKGGDQEPTKMSPKWRWSTFDTHVFLRIHPGGQTEINSEKKLVQRTCWFQSLKFQDLLEDSEKSALGLTKITSIQAKLVAQNLPRRGFFLSGTKRFVDKSQFADPFICFLLLLLLFLVLLLFILQTKIFKMRNFTSS